MSYDDLHKTQRKHGLIDATGWDDESCDLQIDRV